MDFYKENKANFKTDKMFYISMVLIIASFSLWTIYL